VLTTLRTGTSSELAALLAEVLGRDDVAVHSHFFDDLGADSLTMARFCARVRKQDGLPAISMKEIYRHPTIAELSSALEDSVPKPGRSPGRRARAPHVARDRAYVACALAQLALVVGYGVVGAAAVAAGYDWVAAGSGPGERYLRLAGFGSVLAAATCALPIVVKWALVGRWRRTEIAVWSPAYLRFWVVKTLVRSNPLVLAAGTPLYTLYLRALGAQVGRGALVHSRHVPVCTDLVAIGPGAVIHKEVLFSGYHAEAGRIRTGTVGIGAHAHVGEASVLGLDTTLGDGARLGHATSLQEGETLRATQEVVSPTPGAGRVRPLLFTSAQLGTTALLSLPLTLGLAAAVVSEVRQRTGLLASGSATQLATYAEALVVAGATYLSFLVLAFAIVVAVPRAWHLLLEPDREYPLYGLRYWAQRSVARSSNLRFFPRLLGDSSYVVPYLRAVGYDLSPVEQTGSNFGLEIKHDNPFLCRVGTGTMVADGLSMINVDYTSSTFRLSRTVVGERSFLGNYVVYPPRAGAGDDCLLATKLQVPVDGARREHVGLLGSPSFEIPRTVNRDQRVTHLETDADRRAGLAAKNRHNLVSIGLYAGAWCLLLAELLLLATLAVQLSAQLAGPLGPLVLGVAGVLGIALWAVHFTLAERAATLLHPLQPRFCSIYDVAFWRHERFWKLAQQPLVLDGTPFKSLVWRLMGVRMGRRVFDDGCAIVEKTLTTIGDDCTLNARSVVQAHSQEDGAFKADRIVIGSGCTLGAGSLVHYGVTMGDDVHLAPDSFLMKGQEPAAGTQWAGNPARELR
jgi:non-ribosomal peptide synthetase-like protein